MSDRNIRVGELVLREISALLHSRWRTESTAITFTGIDMPPDLKKARIWYSVIGGREDVARAGRLLARAKKELRMKLGKIVILKFTPELEFVFDPSAERAMRVESILDELDENMESQHPQPETNNDESENDCDGSHHAK